MQENNFEKRVQQKMDELSFAPSAPVWQKVELQIQQKHRRRRLVFFLLPLLLVGGGLTWYMAGNNNSLPTVAQHQKKNGELLNEKDNATANQQENELLQKDQSTTNQSIPVTGAQIQKEKQRFLAQKETERFSTTSRNNQKQKGKSSSQRKAAEAETIEEIMSNDLHALVLQYEIDKKEGRVKEGENISNPFQKKQAYKNIDSAETTVAKTNATVTEDIAADSIKMAALPNEKSANDSTVVTASIQPKGKTKVWEWSVNGRVGVSGMRSGIIQIFSQENRSDLFFAPSTGNGAPQPAARVPARTANRTAFSIGGSLRRNASGNTFVSVGLQYSYYSTQSTVGSLVRNDTTVTYNGRFSSLSNYYTNTGSAGGYTNRFHYLELPLALDYRPFKKLPLQLQHGVSIGRLLASNALYQDPAGLYYQSDNWLRKTGFNLFTSVDYRLLQTKRITLFAGPQLQWGLTPVQQKTERKKQHFFFGGLNTQLRF